MRPLPFAFAVCSIEGGCFVIQDGYGWYLLTAAVFMSFHQSECW